MLKGLAMGRSAANVPPMRISQSASMARHDDPANGEHPPCPTLEDLGNPGEFVGAIGVVISLIYPAYQIRQNTSQPS